MDYIDPGIKVYVCMVYNNGMFFLQISPFWNFCLFQLFLHQQNKDNSAPCGLHEVTTLFLLWSNIFSPFECNYRQGSLRIQSFSYFLFRFLRISGLKNQTKNAICVAVIASKTLGFPLDYHDFLSLAVKLKYVLHKLLQTMCILLYFTNGIWCVCSMYRRYRKTYEIITNDFQNSTYIFTEKQNFL